MHQAFKILLWIGSLSVGTIAALLLIGIGIATVRRILHGKQPSDGPFPECDVVKAEEQAAKEGWLHRIFVAGDQFFNVLLWRGWPDETISAHAERAAIEGHRWGIAMCWWLDLIQPQHGHKAMSGDIRRAESVEAKEKEVLGVKDN